MRRPDRRRPGSEVSIGSAGRSRSQQQLTISSGHRRAGVGMTKLGTSALQGKWRIVEMPTWSVDHLNLSNRPTLASGYTGMRPGGGRGDFDWHGFDEGDEVNGDGFVKLQPDPSKASSSMTTAMNQP